MSYTISVEVYQTQTKTFFHCVEKTVWNYANGGTWGKHNGAHVLTMGGNGTCGSLRFVSNTGESFIITLGVHNYKCWGDIVTNLKSDQTAMVVTPQYYSDSHKDREKQMEALLTSYHTQNTQGHKFSFNYTVTNGHNLKCKVVIG